MNGTCSGMGTLSLAGYVEDREIYADGDGSFCDYFEWSGAVSYNASMMTGDWYCEEGVNIYTGTFSGFKKVSNDADGDGCPNVKEQQTAVGSELTGGRRNYLNPNDYFNPSGDGLNRIDDIVLVLNQYYDDDADGNPGLPPYAPGYNPDTDRTVVGPNLWNLGPPNGLQRVDDIVSAINQYYHDCS
jgi:hypothetical protein